MKVCEDCGEEVVLVEHPVWAGVPLQETCACLWITITIAPGIVTWRKIPPMVDKDPLKVDKEST